MTDASILLQVESCLRQGMPINEIKRQTGLSLGKIAYVRDTLDIRKEWASKRYERSLLHTHDPDITSNSLGEEACSLLRQGYPTPDIASVLGVKNHQVIRYRDINGLREEWKHAYDSLPMRVYRLERRYPGISKSIDSGYSSTELGAMYGRSKQCMNGQILAYGLRQYHNERIEARPIGYIPEKFLGLEEVANAMMLDKRYGSKK